MTTSTRKIKFNDLKPSSSPDLLLWGALQDAAYRVMSSGRYIGGKEIEEFEERWAARCGVKYCVACGSGFDALQLAIRAAAGGDMRPATTSHMTCIPTWQAIFITNRHVYGTDVDPRTYNMRPAHIHRIHRVCIDGCRSETGSLIIPVHLYGQPANLPKIRALNPSALIIADGAQAHGTYINSKPVAQFADATTFSFYPTKNLGAYGDAGAVVTDDEALASEMRSLREFWPPNGITSRMDPLQAAFLNAKLRNRYLEYANIIRAQSAAIYMEELADLPIQLPYVPSWATPNWHQFVVRCHRPEMIREELDDRGIETLVHYEDLPGEYYYGGDLKVYPHVATTLINQIFSLPIAEHLSIDDIKYVASNLKEILETL